MAYTREQFYDYANDELARPKSNIPWAPVVGIGLPVAGFAAGFMRTPSGRKVWDVYFKALQHIEGATPMGFAKTFRLSETISPFAAPDRFDLDAAKHADLFRSRGFKDYLSRSTNLPISKLEDLGAFQKGLQWKKTGSVLGDLRVRGGPVLASNIGLMSTGSGRGGHVLEWFARVSGVKKPGFLKKVKENADYLRPNWLPFGNRAKGGIPLIGKTAYGLFSSGIGRMNLLLSSPFDLEVMEEAAKKVPFLGKIKLGVKSGTGLQMLGRYAAKAALPLIAYKGLSYVDYLSREHGRAATVPGLAGVGAAAGFAYGLKKGFGPKYAAIGAAIGGVAGLFGKGPISGAAEIYAQARITQAGLAETTGLGSGARRVEDYFPGLSKPTTLVASAGLGLLLGGTYEWGKKLSLLRSARKPDRKPPSGKAARDIYEDVDEAIKRRQKKFYDKHAKEASRQTGLSKMASELKQKWYGSKSKGGFRGAGAGKYAAVGAAGYQALNVVGSAIAGDYAGAALSAGIGVAAAAAYAKRGSAAGAAVLGLQYLLREKDDPEQLKRIYSGEELVDVRAGRWWEAGRTPFEGSRPYYRPHRVATMRTGGIQESALYGSEEAYWDSDPLLHPLRFLTNPYKREELMWKQGYKFPVSKTPFEDYPVIGPLLAATVGKVLKPAKFLGREEWLADSPGGPTPAGWSEIPPEDPVMRTGLTGTIGEQSYRLTELVGLPGFAAQSVYGAITGDDSVLPRDQWATPSLVSGAEPAWWSLELGGGALLCIPEGSTVQTSFGNKAIEDVTIDDSVFSRDGSFRKVKATSRRKDTKITSVSVMNLGSILRATPNHVVPVLEKVQCHNRSSRSCISGKRGKSCSSCSRRNIGVQTIDKPIGDICIGDWLEVPLPCHSFKDTKVDLISNSRSSVYTDSYIYTSGTQSYAEAKEIIEGDNNISRKELRDLGISDQFAKEALHSYRKGSSPQRFDRFVSLNSDVAYLLGWYAAEGSLFSSGIQLSMNIREEKFAKKLQRISKREFNASSSIYRYPEKHTLCLHIFSPSLRCLAQKLVGEGSHTKSVDPQIMFGSSSIRAAFLRGYMLGDGFCNIEKGKSGISTVSKDLANQVLLIGLSLGFRGLNVIDYLEKPNGFYPGNIPRKDTLRHYVEWSKTTVPLLGNFLRGKLDVLPPHGKNKGSFISDGKLYVQVKEVKTEERDETWVYDLEIEDLHYFTSEYITVHNSEGIRRYIPHKRNDIEYKNPLPSGLPSWMPGSDSGYFIDFSRAESYAKIKEPWARLPGPGFAKLHPELKGLNPEQYPDFWKFKILADVAPWSKEYGQYEKALSQMTADNRLSAEQALEVQSTRKRVADAKKAKQFQQYRYDSDSIQKVRVKVTEELGPGVYATDSFGSAPITLSGLNTGGLSLANVAMREDASLTASDAIQIGQRKRAQISDFLRDYVRPGSEIDVYVNKDPSAMIERGADGSPIIPTVMSVGGINLNRSLVENGLAQSMASGGGLDPMMATGGIQRAFGSFWENLMHGAETPLESFTPLAPVAKFVHQRTALEEYQRAEVYGKDVALWQKPITHFLAPGLSTSAWWAGWRGLPREVQEKYMVDEYFDHLEHQKWRRLERAAAAKGEGELAASYAKNIARTKSGGDILSERGAYLTLSSKERAYFNEFVKSPTPTERSQISQVVSPQMREILHAQWGRRASESAQLRAEAGIRRPGDGAALAAFEQMQSREAQMERQAEHLAATEQLPMPGPRWVGWDPNAETQDYKVKTINDAGMDLARFGVWDSDLRRVEGRPWVSSMGASFQEYGGSTSSMSLIRRKFLRRLGLSGERPPTVTLSGAVRGDFDIQSPGHDRLDRYLRDPSIMQF